MAMCSMAVQAQGTMEWALVESSGGETVLMSRVAFLLAADGEDTFAVVCNDGRMIGGVQSVSFIRVDPTGIEAVGRSGEEPLLSGVDGRLRLTGCKTGTAVAVYDGGGRQVAAAVASGSEAVVDVSGLAAGVYILSADGVKVKFMKR